MSEDLLKKKAQLEALAKEVKEMEEKSRAEKEKAESDAAGLYKPLAIAKVARNLYYKSERDFEEIGDEEWYCVSEILGDPQLKRDQGVVLLSIADDEEKYWFPANEENDYYSIEEVYIGMLDNKSNRRYLKEIKLLK